MAAARNLAPHLSPFRRRAICQVALVDERTFKRALKGECVRSTTRERIARALAEQGLGHLLPAEPIPQGRR
jgi:hypothetical protein